MIVQTVCRMQAARLPNNDINKTPALWSLIVDMNAGKMTDECFVVHLDCSLHISLDT